MDLLEIVGEATKPGPIGKVDIETSSTPSPLRWWMWVKGVLALAVLSVWLYLVCFGIGADDVLAAVAVLAMTYFYLWLAYRLRPRPNDENLGFVGGLIDHPLRISDDINRMLVGLWLVFLPGRIVAINLMLLVRAIWPGRSAAATSLTRNQ